MYIMNIYIYTYIYIIYNMHCMYISYKTLLCFCGWDDTRKALRWLVWLK